MDENYDFGTGMNPEKFDKQANAWKTLCNAFKTIYDEREGNNKPKKLRPGYYPALDILGDPDTINPLSDYASANINFTDSLEDALLEGHADPKEVEFVYNKLKDPEFRQKNSITDEHLKILKVNIPENTVTGLKDEPVHITRVTGHHGHYLTTIVTSLYDTKGKFSKDSDEYKKFKEAVNKASDNYSFYDLENTYTPNRYKNYEQSMKELKKATYDYIKHCKDHPKSGSRRAERLELANKVYNICSAFEKNKTVREYLKDNIAANYYAALVVNASRNKKKFPTQQEADDYKKANLGKNSPARKNGTEAVKGLDGFKDLVGKEMDVDKLFKMHEEPLKTSKRINNAVLKSKNPVNVKEFQKNLLNGNSRTNENINKQPQKGKGMAK